MWLIVLAGFLHCASAYEVDPGKLEGLARARVESCGGWQLNRLREVKNFVTRDIPLYHNLVMKHIPGADPELVLLNHYHEELDRIPLSDLTCSEINKLLEDLGFYKKAHPDAEVPEEHRHDPAKSSPFKDEPPAEGKAPEAEGKAPEAEGKAPEAEGEHVDL